MGSTSLPQEDFGVWLKSVRPPIAVPAKRQTSVGAIVCTVAGTPMSRSHMTAAREYPVIVILVSPAKAAPPRSCEPLLLKGEEGSKTHGIANSAHLVASSAEKRSARWGFGCAQRLLAKA